MQESSEKVKAVALLHEINNSGTEVEPDVDQDLSEQPEGGEPGLGREGSQEAVYSIDDAHKATSPPGEAVMQVLSDGAGTFQRASCPLNVHYL